MNEINTIKFVVKSPTISEINWKERLPKIKHNNIYSGYHPLELFFEDIIFYQNNISIFYETNFIELDNKDKQGIKLKTNQDWDCLLQKYWITQVKNWTRSQNANILTNIRAWTPKDFLDYQLFITELRKNYCTQEFTQYVNLTTVTIIQLNLFLSNYNEELLKNNSQIIYKKREYI